MIAAGYNRGSKPSEYVDDDRGDPRLGEMDVVDWIEHIPFRETRNYVMRVTESLPVYRARLRGEVGPLDSRPCWRVKTAAAPCPAPRGAGGRLTGARCREKY